jgi:YVTN family beta-propeller protein
MKHTLLFLMISVILFSCKKEKIELPDTTLEGIFVINEGNFQSGNGSITFYEPSTGKIVDNLFNINNSHSLGDVALSMNIFNGFGYIVVNNSQKVEVVTMNNFKWAGTIGNLSSPRYFLPVNAVKGYITDWISNSVAVVNLNTYQVEKNINTGNGPEQMAIAGNKVYVTNGGGFGDDSTITVINTFDDTVLKTLAVGRNPNSIAKDKNGNLWVICNGDIGPDWIGGTADDIAGELLRINPANDSIEARFPMSAFDHPMKLTINSDGTQIYYLNGMSGFDGKIYAMDITDNSLPASPVIDKIFYGLGIDPVTNNILGAYVPGFSQKGYMFRYTSTGNFIDSVQVGIIPNGFAFN